MKRLIIGLICALGIFGSANAAQQSGFFIGGNVGAPINVANYGGFFNNSLLTAESGNSAELSDTLKSILPATSYGWGVGVDLGFKQALSKSMGLKYYINYMYSYSYGSSNKTTEAGLLGSSGSIGNFKSEIEQHLITLNIDYYYNPVDVFGVYIGLGFGYQGYAATWKPTMSGEISNVDMEDLKLNSRGGFAMPLNVGFTFNATDNHQITLGAKIPLIQYKYKINADEGLGHRFGESGQVKFASYIVQIGYNYTF